jgi:rubrerythrin
MDTRDFLERALLNEQEQVRDYQRFADSTEDEEVARVFRDFAETEAFQARKIKELLEKYDSDA